MSVDQKTYSGSGKLLFNKEYNSLELDGYELQNGESIEIRVFGSWVPGKVAVDSSGWYLHTLDQVGIRLQTGLPARFFTPHDSQNAFYKVDNEQPPRILIVDDDPALLQALPRTISLHISDAQIDVSNSASEALQLLESHRYDTIVSDIKMPGMNGIQLLYKVQEVRPEIPFLLMTGHGEYDLAIQALRGGAYDFIQKPLVRDAFIGSLRRAIQACQLRRRVEEQQSAIEIHARSLEHLVEQRTDDLEKANETKDRVINLISHELKVPLQRLQEITQMLQAKLAHTDMEEVVSRGFHDIESSISRTENLIQDLLNTSQIETRMFILHRELCNLVGLGHEVLKQKLPEQGAQLLQEEIGSSLNVMVDRERLTDVFTILLAWSQVHSDEMPVTLALQQAGSKAIITLRDLVSSEETGSDLHIAKKIIERHGGQLEIQKFPGDRTTIFVLLPMRIEWGEDHEVPLPSSQTHASWTIQYHLPPENTTPEND